MLKVVVFSKDSKNYAQEINIYVHKIAFILLLLLYSIRLLSFNVVALIGLFMVQLLCYGLLCMPL